MKEFRYTPGNWQAKKVRSQSDDYPVWAIMVEGYGRIAEVEPEIYREYPQPPGKAEAEGKANAQLMAVAPRLLVALMECITDKGAACHNATKSSEYICKLNRRLDAINTIATTAIETIEGDG